MKLPIYLDYAATTPVDPRVAKKMMQYLTLEGIFGNPSSRSHLYGWQADEAVDIARNQIAHTIGADIREIIFTSGATESNNLAIKGAAYANFHKGRHIITSMIEHKSVLDSCTKLEQEGFKLTLLKPLSNGLITLKQLQDSLLNDTILVSIMHVNNEIGVIQDIYALGKLCRENNILFHVDATQSIGKLPIDLKKNSFIDFMSFSGHKIYGPKGIGVLYISRKPWVKITPQIHGGNHERGMRSGTLPVHQIVGMGEAIRIASEEMHTEMPRLHLLRNLLWEKLKQIPGIQLNGDLVNSIATIINISFSSIDGEALILMLKDVAISSSAACTTATLEFSHVLHALHTNPKKSVMNNSPIRISIGRFTTKEEIDFAADHIYNVVLQLSQFYL
ncbi:IscS subfamily cysteine desulfurase [Candidatus Schneideria nysicola]|uniref:IscS subfamily cysteine desulfurase n=1 Tax=Candidatus Schneideria nysicola TaxID=1081631 RepID=UPI001CAA7C1E|nr:IscS subfamily cysteine desulfurase [Candidatus Schneideria nysicola]UAJ65421.1 IscS subfamily cysteine desulfurase [Candidatus Schneideria nysicola]